MTEERRAYYAWELPQNVHEAIMNAKMDPKHDHLNHLNHLMEDDVTQEENQTGTIAETVADTTGSVTDPESTANPPALRSAGNPTLTQVLQAELREHALIALNYRQKITSAKTDVKKNYFKKKLKKNNEAALKILVALDRISTASIKRQKVADEPKQDPQQ